MRDNANDPDDLGDVVLSLKEALNRASLVELTAAIIAALFRAGAPQRLKLQLDARSCALIRTDSATPSRLQIARESVDTHGGVALVERIVRRAPTPFDLRPPVLACMRLALLEQDVTPGPQHSVHVTSWLERLTVHIDVTDENVTSLLVPDLSEPFLTELTTRLRVARQKFDVQIWRPALLSRAEAARNPR